ncbi:sensor histidine kinase [Streptomyces tsukubensis]|uniref:histidine kinase n=1 Tax=Streptomyces tsukubensis TaxID=83656 RepID=A0A1V4A5F8_9ACTN|nr:sensor histidine kinase [Streptomyces tsukubensis]OON75593.1 sensor histidine kinase [Streptomyces tsukubensis]QFR94427.1 sensor histidine kinase [Streptomyces tsukubensis]
MRETVRRAWTATVHLFLGGGLSLLCFFFVPLFLFTALAVALVVGAGVLPESVLLLRRAAGFKRRQVEVWSGPAVPDAYAPLVGGLSERVRAAARDAGTRRDLWWAGAYVVYGWLLACAVMPLWPLGAVVDGVWCGMLRQPAVLLPLIGRLADLDTRWSRALLTPTPEALRSAGLARRVEELALTRAGAVAAHGAELRRIERDLHDGAQARLVALSMRVGLARMVLDKDAGADPATLRGLLSDVQDQAEEALTELRHVVRGIHPPILTDRGLVGAVRALAASGALDVSVSEYGLAEGPRPPAAVEAAAYFVVAEALTNAAKHSGSERAAVELRRSDDRLIISVRDEGCGGADTSAGSGLLGVRRRVAALDGTVDVNSPLGGPTLIGVELPCVW